jgi:CRISPR-associated endonuclease/helicase Cas3
MPNFPDFPAYFHALWGYDPFPWQCRLAGEVATGSWPAWITLPTGVGKTATLDIAIYDLARQAARSDRHAPVRIVFAVNRRIVVDEAFERAKRIAGKLKQALDRPTDPLQPVALALRELSGLANDEPLRAYPLRGGTFTDHSWARTPTQPLVLTTTLDQLGSRLLFRGYGVSESARPIHAALLANDALLILDEAHTSQAFSQTLESIAKLRGRSVQEIPLPFQTVQLTATPPTEATCRFLLDGADRANDVIARRLGSPKPAILLPVIEGKPRHDKIAAVICVKATDLAADHSRLLIVVNRVATAIALVTKLAKEKKQHGADVRLLTGRIRPLDRQALIGSLEDEHELRSAHPSGSVRKLILIATQTIEVGADYDFDALITELAPLDSLRQRFGRLNRQGRDIPAPALIFAPEEALDRKQTDPIYGNCLPDVWEWLETHRNADGIIDFGINALDAIAPTGAALAPLLAPCSDAPVLLAPQLDLLCQTSPEPHVSPDPALYIHGPGRDFPEVSVILRHDLGEHAKALLEAAPPLAAEAATVPLSFVKAWLASPKGGADPGGDVPATREQDEKKSAAKVSRAAWIWRKGEAIHLGETRDLKPGDFLVLGTEAEHLDDLLPSLDLSTPGRDLDQFEEAYLLSRDKLCIRLHPAAISELKSRLPEGQARIEFAELLCPLTGRDEVGELPPFREKDWQGVIPKLAGLLGGIDPPVEIWKLATRLNATDWSVAPLAGPLEGGVVIVSKNRVGHTAWPLEPSDSGRQDLSANQPVLLADHSVQVAEIAAGNAIRLSDALRQALRDAGLWHDAGKLDPRFQALLHGYSLHSIPARAVLAKSGSFRGRELEKALRKRARLPDGFRHELLSTLIAAASEKFAAHPERDLLLHLIASHHGRCRAMAPIVRDEAPMEFVVELEGESIRYPGDPHPLAAIDSGVAERFWTLTRRFGWWGLPYLESLLRLADQSASADPAPTP